MIIEKLKTKPTDLYLLIITIAALVLFLLINILVFGQLSGATPPYGILDLEFAWTVERVQEIFAAWGAAGIQLHILGVYWDMPYILGYGFFIFGCILLVSRRLIDRFQIIGLWICFFPLVAGLFDLFENINLLIMLYNPASFPSYVPMLTGILATIKFTLLVIGIVFFFIALVIVVVAYVGKKLK